MTVLGKRFLKRRKGCLCLGDLGAVEQNVRSGRCPDLELALHDPELLFLFRCYRLCRLELRPQQRLLTAAVTMFAVSARWAPSSWKR
jgi:hypothetical protein